MLLYILFYILFIIRYYLNERFVFKYWRWDRTSIKQIWNLSMIKYFNKSKCNTAIDRIKDVALFFFNENKFKKKSKNKIWNKNKKVKLN